MFAVLTDPGNVSLAQLCPRHPRGRVLHKASARSPPASLLAARSPLLYFRLFPRLRIHMSSHSLQLGAPLGICVGTKKVGARVLRRAEHLLSLGCRL